MQKKGVLLINPWIYDFSAYDLWAKPLGLLSIGALLRENGFSVNFIDCLEINTSDRTAKRKLSGDGKFSRQIIAKPAFFKNIPRNYSRYGMSPDVFREKLLKTSEENRVDAVLVTSFMTYWYPGVFDVIKIAKEIFPKTPVVLGGIYASLCEDHARTFSGADYVIAGEGEIAVLNLLAKILDVAPRRIPDMADLDSYPYASFDLIENLKYVCIQTAKGCPFRCTYCASYLLTSGMRMRAPAKVADEIEFWNKNFGVENFAFYDDALLVGPGNRVKDMLNEIIKRDLSCKFYCPNGLHARAIDDEIAMLMKDAGFASIRLGFETADEHLQKTTGAKVFTHEVERAIESLLCAGFDPEKIGVYILCGLPHQEALDVEKAIDIVRSCGVWPNLAEYSPIPGTALWDEAVKVSPYPIEKEPLFHNNSVLPCRWEGFTYEAYCALKQKARQETD
jgi:radical SAM superfamily enzyme YgiQ (UPF0313 family)